PHFDQRRGRDPGDRLAAARPGDRGIHRTRSGLTMQSYYEATARERIAGILDAESWREILPPAARTLSPHLAALDLPVAFDDGVVIGSGTLEGLSVLIAAQEGGFMGGAVGEVQGAKIVGLFERAATQRAAGVVL